MDYRRKHLEERQKKEEDLKEEDRKRKLQQNKLKERVTQSKNLVDNRKKLEESKREKQETFKRDLKREANEYKMALEKMKQKIYNKPLQFEENQKSSNKLKVHQNAKAIVDECMNDEEIELEQ